MNYRHGFDYLPFIYNSSLKEIKEVKYIFICGMNYHR